MIRTFKTLNKIAGWCIFSVLTSLLWPSFSLAHLVNTGLGPFYDGILHLAMSPDDLMNALALALLAGISGAKAGRYVIFLLPSIWLVGGIIGLYADQEISWSVFSTLSFLVAGSMVAMEYRPPFLMLLIITGGFGFLHGFLNGTAMSQNNGGWLSLLGISLAVFILVALISAQVASIKSMWVRTVVRIAGSWMAAVGLLMLGWSFRGTGLN